MSVSRHRALIHTHAGTLDPLTVEALVLVESSDNAWAMRFEPAWYARMMKTAPTLTITEWAQQAFSWGLMQLLGVVAREEGYHGDLGQLLDPGTGLRWGCQHFQHLMRSVATEAEAIRAWNVGLAGAKQGRGQEYLAKVLAMRGKLER